MRQRHQRPGVEPGVNARGGKYERPCLAVLSGDGAQALAARRDDVGIPPPVTAEIDGKAATLIMCHGRPDQ